MLDAGVPLVAVVFPVAAVSALDAREALDQLDHHAVLRHLVAELALDRWERSQLALGRDLVALAGMRVTRLPTAHSLDQVPQATCRRPFGVSTRGGFARTICQVRDRPHGRWVNGPGSKRSRVLGHWGRSDGAADRLPDIEDRAMLASYSTCPPGLSREDKP